MLVSFDIFDTCLLRKCGTPMNMYDVLSYKVFSRDVPDDVRNAFAIERKRAEDRVWKSNPHILLKDIYSDLQFENKFLLTQEKLIEQEIILEKAMLVPSIKAREVVDKYRREGNRIIFISDMYLPHSLIEELLTDYGFFINGDGLYISNEYGMTKESGGLFRTVKKIEKAKFHNWKHFGDNHNNDVKVPKSLGIDASLLNHEYLPYPKQWKRSTINGFNYKSVLSGVSRSLYYSLNDDAHKAFVLDLVAPFYCSYAYRILSDARRKGISRLFFCARDTYQLFNVAKQFVPLFPEINIDYLFISRESLYNGDDDAKYLYFQESGLATTTDSVAIVDITTSGKTILELNKYLSAKGCKKVYGYFFLLWNDARDISVDWNYCHFEIEEVKIRGEQSFDNLLNHLFVFENFFALNDQPRTIDYRINNGHAEPVFDSSITNIETFHPDARLWSDRHIEILNAYAELFIECNLYHYSEQIMYYVSLPTLCSFFDIPADPYIHALKEYQIYSKTKNSHTPYIRHSNLFHLMIKRGRDSVWSRGSIMYSMPNWFKPILHSVYSINNAKL